MDGFAVAYTALVKLCFAERCKKAVKQISPNLVTNKFGFIDVLIRFWVKRSKVKVTAKSHNFDYKF